MMRGLSKVILDFWNLFNFANPLSVKRFERSNGLDSALYIKNYLSFNILLSVLSRNPFPFFFSKTAGGARPDGRSSHHLLGAGRQESSQLGELHGAGERNETRSVLPLGLFCVSL